MPTPDTADYEYRKPLETALAALDDLGGQWDDLSGAAQTDLTAMLASFRVRLFRAEGDAARGTAVPALLYALEDAPTLPTSTATLLQAAHQSRRRAFLTVGSEQAREIKQQIDRLIGPDYDLAPSTAPATSDEAFLEAPKIAERVISRLNSRWTELSLLGQDQVFLWLRSYDDALANASNDYERLLATHDFLRQVKEDPVVYALVEDAFTVRSAGIPSFSASAQAMTQQEAGRMRDLIDRNPLMAVPKTPWGSEIHFGMAESAPPPPPLALAEMVETTVVDYHTDVRFPGQVSTFDQNIPLRVRLALEKSESSVVDETVAIEFSTPDPQQVLVVCNAEGFIVDSEDTADTTRTILVYPGKDSQWAVFLLTPDPEAGPGRRHIGLDFYHRGRLAGTARFEVEVRDRPPIEEFEIKPEPMIVDRAEDGSVVEQVAGGFVFSSEDAPKPDFELRITLSADRRQLSYTLHSPDGKLGLVHRRMGTVTLETDPRTFLENTLLQLSQMARASRKKLSDAQIAANQEKLREIGWDLYEQLFTGKLKQAYRDLYQLRQKEKNLSLLIVSDEPWIPWEMVLPHEGLPGDDFLCAQFRLTRWLEGRGLPEDFSLH
ncbi:MAG TPA: hypothetical protein VL334_19545, partial [Anaerolineae bacterium]|nr:hypothetical protein [Anaerolineae bacterium]